MTLDELQIGRKAVIVGVGGEGALRCRLLDMGLIPKTSVEVRKVAPMGDPIEIRIRGYELTIRKEDAKEIEIEIETGEENPLLLQGQSHFASQNKEDL